MNRNLLLLLGGGALLLWYLDQQKKTPAASSGTAPASTGAPGAQQPSPTSSGQPTAPAASAAPYAGTLQKIKDAINTSGVSTTYIFGQQAADTWNWYAMNAIPGWTAPSPETLYPGVPDAHKPVTFDDWWKRVQPFLPTGLSGFQPRSALFNRVYGGWMA